MVKDTSALIQNRKLIEKRMEQFKECEREVKTKAFSKEGLAKAEEIGSEDEEVRDTLEWVSKNISALKLQAEELEVPVSHKKLFAFTNLQYM